MLKRICVLFLALALTLSLCVIPAAAADSYTVTFSEDATVAGVNGATSVAVGEDYSFTMTSYDGIVAYADFGGGHICAPELTTENGSIVLVLDHEYITGSFEIKTFNFSDAEPSTFLSGSGADENDPCLINSELDLLKLMVASTSQFNSGCKCITAGYYYKLTNDIVFHTPLCSCISLVPGRTSKTKKASVLTKLGGKVSDSFTGTFDGDGHTISGLQIKNIDCDNISFITNVSAGGTIKDLSLVYANPISIAQENPIIGTALNAKPTSFSGLTNTNAGTIENCNVTVDVNSEINKIPSSNTTRTYIGNIAGTNQNTGKIKNCKVESNIVHESGAYVYIGLICGQNQGGSITDCQSSGTLKVNAGKTGDYSCEYYVGGIVGDSAYTSGSVVNNCVNRANITINETGTSGLADVGGIAGKNLCDLNYCANYGSISCTNAAFETRFGGISGQITNDCIFKGCYNVGAITLSGTSEILTKGSLAGFSGTSFNATASFSYVNGLPLYGTAESESVSYVYELADKTVSQVDETTEEMEVSAADFVSPTFDLAGRLNSALGATDDPIFVPGEKYPIFSWLASGSGSETTDLLAETGVVDTASADAAGAAVTATATGSTATITVTCDKACTVVAYDGTSYTRLAYDGTNGHVFTTDAYAPGMTFTVALKGDVSGDGDITAADWGALVEAFNGTALSVLNMLIGDVSGNGDITSADWGSLVEAFNGSALSWTN